MRIIAYLDPGTGTLIVQAVLGGAAGAAVLFKTKGRKLFKRNSASEETNPAVADGDNEGTTVPTIATD
jgi:hypothetical protein